MNYVFSVEMTLHKNGNNERDSTAERGTASRGNVRVPHPKADKAFLLELQDVDLTLAEFVGLAERCDGLA